MDAQRLCFSSGRVRFGTGWETGQATRTELVRAASFRT